MSEWEDPAPKMGRQIYRAMHYGILSGVATLSTTPLREALVGQEIPHSVHGALNRIDEYIQDFGPVGEAMDRLDATRPKPVFTSKGISRTIDATLTDVAALKYDTVRVCPIHYELVEEVDAKGQKVYKWVGYLLWPEGTLHNRSRFHAGTAHNNQCHACGHAIRNTYNWVPILIDGQDGTPYSFWTGRDCAETLFGIKMVGELELKRGPGA
jgi:hypothetical protein